MNKGDAVAVGTFTEYNGSRVHPGVVERVIDDTHADIEVRIKGGEKFSQVNVEMIDSGQPAPGQFIHDHDYVAPEVPKAPEPAPKPKTYKGP